MWKPLHATTELMTVFATTSKDEHWKLTDLLAGERVRVMLAGIPQVT